MDKYDILPIYLFDKVLFKLNIVHFLSYIGCLWVADGETFINVGIGDLI